MRRSVLQSYQIKTIYFGGGTPSLVDPKYITLFLEALAKNGVNLNEVEEINLEIDPGTRGQDHLDTYIAAGISRFSVGVQTLDEAKLKRVGRKHSVAESVRLLDDLANRNLNFSLDVLFSLPGQTPNELRADLKHLVQFQPKHVSAYYLTVDANHPLQANRPRDEQDLEMFAILQEELATNGIIRYEISNYAKPGFESKHNLVYWNDQAYLGLGLSSHSYLPGDGACGRRFFNADKMETYKAQIEKQKSWVEAEDLSLGESLTDFCHISLRLRRGLVESTFAAKYGVEMLGDLHRRRDRMRGRGLVELTSSGFRLTDEGCNLANVVFEEFTFLPEELTTYRR